MPSTSARSDERYVTLADAKRVVRGRETQVLDKIGIPWAQGNPHILCPYPGHDDRNPSWRWDQRRSRAYCSCLDGARSHSVFDVVMAVEGLDFSAACLRIAELLEPTVIKTRRGADFPGCRLVEYAEAKQLPLADLRSFGLQEIRLGGRSVVAIPYLNPEGHETATRLRVGLNGNARFRWKRGSRLSLYGLDRLHRIRAGHVVLCEGESDCHTAWHHEFPALGLPGNTTWNEERDAPHVADIPCVYAAIEPGNSGAEMRRRLARSSIQPRLRLVRFSDRIKDISDLHLADPEGFRAAFQAMLDHAEPCPPPPDLPDGGGLRYREFGRFTMDDDGLKYTPKEPDKSPLWLAAAFEVVGWLRQHQGDGWGLLLRWADRDGRRHQWAMQVHLLAGRQEDVLKPLLDGGLKISTSLAARTRLVQYLGSVEVNERFWTSATAGWLDDGNFLVPPAPTVVENEGGDSERTTNHYDK